MSDVTPKVLEVTMPDGSVWGVPVDVIARQQPPTSHTEALMKYLRNALRGLALGAALASAAFAQGVPEHSLVRNDLTHSWTQSERTLISGQVFAEHVDVTEPTVFLACLFEGGVTFRNESWPSAIYRSEISNNIPNGAAVRCEPESRARIEACRFTGCAGAGVLLTGGLTLYRCDFTAGAWADNVIGCDGWNGGVIDRCLFVEGGITIGEVTTTGMSVGNATINARHAGNGETPGLVVIRYCTVIARRAIIAGHSGPHVELYGNEVYAPSDDGLFAYKGWKHKGNPASSTFPAIAEGNSFTGTVRLELFSGVSSEVMVKPQEPLDWPGQDINGLMSDPLYGCSDAWSGLLEGTK